MPRATWQGPYTAFLPDGQLVRQGDEREVTDGDLLSDHWQPAGQPAPAPSPLVISSPPSLPSAPSSPSIGEAD